MFDILGSIEEWFRGILIGCIVDNLSGMFDEINSGVGEIAANVGKTPAAWNAGVFSMIQTLSDNVVVPLAGIILTFVLTYELISMRSPHEVCVNCDVFLLLSALNLVIEFR